MHSNEVRDLIKLIHIIKQDAESNEASAINQAIAQLAAFNALLAKLDDEEQKAA